MHCPINAIYWAVSFAKCAPEQDVIGVATIKELMDQLQEAVNQRQWRVGTAESCTGGKVAVALTDVHGSSRWFEGGLVTYSNAAKQAQLGVAAETLKQYGAVSRQTVEEMARGACERLQVDLSVAISGIAGPSGGTADKPVGTVWFAWSSPLGVRSAQHLFYGNRGMVRDQAVKVALQGLVDCCYE